jgi:hypothetical protein
MDFLEGFLLGPLWSDTEYETQKHIGFHLFLGAVIAALFFVVLISPDRLSFWLGLPTLLYVIMLVLFFLAAPFTARLYYQLPWPVKLLILFLQIIKFCCAYLIAFKVFLPKFEISLADLPETLMEEVNASISSATGFFEKMGRTSGMLLGIVGGGAMVVLRLLLIIVIAVLVPVVILLVLKLLQRLWDTVTQRFILREQHT